MPETRTTVRPVILLAISRSSSGVTRQTCRNSQAGTWHLEFADRPVSGQALRPSKSTQRRRDPNWVLTVAYRAFRQGANPLSVAR